MLALLAPFPLLLGLFAAGPGDDDPPFRPEQQAAIDAINEALDRDAFDEAEPLIRDLLARHAPDDDLENDPDDEALNESVRLWCFDALAFVLADDEHRLDEALDHAERAVAGYSDAFGPDDLASAGPLERLAAIHYRLGNLERAEDSYRKALAAYEASIGGDDPSLADLLGSFGWLLLETDRFDEATSLLERCRAIREADPDPSELVRVLYHLGWLRSQAGAFDEAGTLLQRAASLSDDDHPDLVEILGGLAELAEQQDRPFAEVRALRERAAERAGATLGPEAPETITALCSLARTLRLGGSPEESAGAYRRALDAFEAADRDDPPLLSAILMGFGNVSRSLNRTEEAEHLLTRGLALAKDFHGPDHVETAAFHYSLYRLYDRLGRDDEAQSCYDQARTIMERRSESAVDP